MPRAATTYPDKITPRQAEYLALIQPGETVTAQELANRASSLHRTRKGRKTWPRPVPTFTAMYQLNKLQVAKKVKRVAGGGHGKAVNFRRIA